jgi:peroxiredoxin
MGQTTLLLSFSALGLAALGTMVIWQLLRQQGRLLLRLERLERHLGIHGEDSVQRGTVALQAADRGGLPSGTALPGFELPDLEGRPVSLKAFRDRKVLLVNWSARCGFCELIAPDLGRLRSELDKAGVELLLVGHAGQQERTLAEEHGLGGALLIDDGSSIEAFASLGTPSAYLLDADGRTAAPLAVGADQVLELAETLAPRKPSFGTRDVGRSRIERNGLKPGTPAPTFELPEVRGGKVALDEFRGRKVLLVFSDPHCGPCQDLAPDLIRLSEKHRGNGLEVVMVGRGDVEENRRKAEQLGLEFPVALQHGWELSKRYGIFATPVAFMIDEQGVIAKDVAKGKDEILDLISEPSQPWREVAHGRAL